MVFNIDIFYFKKLNKLKSHGISSKHSGKLFRFKLSVKKNPAINFRTKFSAIFLFLRASTSCPHSTRWTIRALCDARWSSTRARLTRSLSSVCSLRWWVSRGSFGEHFFENVFLCKGCLSWLLTPRGLVGVFTGPVGRGFESWPWQNFWANILEKSLCECGSDESL